MTVLELIKTLEAWPKDLEIVVELTLDGLNLFGDIQDVRESDDYVHSGQIVIDVWGRK